MADSSLSVPSGTIATRTNASSEHMQVLHIGQDGSDDVGTTQNFTVLPLIARTATAASADFTNLYGRYIDLHIDVTAIVTTPSITVTIQGKAYVSSTYYTVLTGAALTTVTTQILRVGPSLTAAANSIANFALPRTWRVNVVHGDADSITYSISASVV